MSPSFYLHFGTGSGSLKKSSRHLYQSLAPHRVYITNTKSPTYRWTWQILLAIRCLYY